MSAAASTDEQVIRAARAFSNQAIVNKDIDGIASVWKDDILVLGSTSVQLAGAQANRRFYSAQFARRPDTLWVRTPSAVSVMPAWRVGLEEGHWSGQWTEPDGPIEMSGRYMAQWVRVEHGWLIQGELYVPTSCVGGDYCACPSGEVVGPPTDSSAVLPAVQFPEQ
jgi:ketosteroid isomerase-like protein